MNLFCNKPSCFSYVTNDHVHELVSLKYHDSHIKSRKICNKTRSPPASQIFKGQGTEHTTVKWPISDIFKGIIKKKLIKSKAKHYKITSQAKAFPIPSDAPVTTKAGFGS